MALERGQLSNPNQASPTTITTSLRDLEIKIDHLPKLEADGSNWGSYRDRMVFQLGCRSDSLAGHLTNAEVPKSLAGADTETADLEAASRWKHEDAIVRHCIAFSIPDEVFAVVRRGTSAKDYWDNLKARFESKSRWIRVEVRRKLYDQKCGNKDDVRAHLARLFSLQEQLFAAGGCISDDDFSYLILDSLPDAYDTLVSSIKIAALFSKDGVSLPLMSMHSLPATTREGFREVQHQDHQIGDIDADCTEERKGNAQPEWMGSGRR